MSSNGTLTRVVAAGGALLALLAGGFWYFFSYAPAHQAAALKTSLANGYATESLHSPFVLQSKTWNTGSRQWVYVYTTSLNEADTVAAAKSQFGPSVGYQVDAHHPDVVNAAEATLYRDLITEDVAVGTDIRPATDGSMNTVTTVTLSQM
jgi:hypothetical protein